jgi:hypothetical protein
MQVSGHDPFLSVDAAWSLSRAVKKAASIEDLNKIRELLEKGGDVEIRHSHPAALCDAMREIRETLPVVNGDLQRCFTGCYTSAAYIKRGHRLAEG